MLNTHCGILLGNMDFTQAIILGTVQGITEFLPISSSGHLVLFQNLLHVESTDTFAFDAVLHLATVLAVIIYFSKDIWILIQALLRKLGRLPVNAKDITMVYALVIGTIPGVMLGLFLEELMSSLIFNTLLVAVLLFGAACFFIFAEWNYFNNPRTNEITVKRGFQIGLFQAVALLPGFSRSGVTIAGGMILGLSRIEASRFSFLLAIPITLGVGFKKLFDLIGHTEAVVWGPIVAGALVAFVVAIAVIHYFLKFISKYTLWPFIWYTILMSLFVGYLYFVV